MAVPEFFERGFLMAVRAIESIRARKILDSRGNWTVEAEVNGFMAAAPSGASTGTFEAKVIHPDIACAHINTTLQEMVGMELDQKSIDSRLAEIDGTKDFSRIGGNASIALSLAVHKAIISEHKRANRSFPYPLGNVLGGGAHGGESSFQEFLVLPSSARDIFHALDTNSAIYHRLKEELAKRGILTGINDEGALTAKIPDSKALDLLSEICEDFRARVGIDAASTKFWDGRNYVFAKGGKGNVKITAEKRIDSMISLVKSYDLAYLEDPLHEEDFLGFAEITKKVGDKCLVTGDDLFVTSADRIRMGARLGSANAAIIKPNQAGTVTRAFEAASAAKAAGMVPVVSHRSGETGDSAISELAVQWDGPIIKAGVVDIRIAVLNGLLRLWDSTAQPYMEPLPEQAVFPEKRLREIMARKEREAAEQMKKEKAKRRT